MPETCYSLIIPVYKNEGSIPALLEMLECMNGRLGGRLETIFVVDGSPDASFTLIRDALATAPFRSQLIAHSRNFGSFAAIRTGLQRAA